MAIFRFISLFAASLGLMALSNPPQASSKAGVVQRADIDLLTQEFANFRRTQIAGDVSYKLSLEFVPGSETFLGRTTIDADLMRLDAPLSIDFSGTKLSSVIVNGASLKDYSIKKGSVEIPASYLKDHVSVALEFEGKFADDGSGMNRFVDPADGKEYLYSDFEPYSAHRLFPCFDQPNIKAKYFVEVKVPKAWQAIGNNLIKTSEDLPGDKKIVSFGTTLPISPYLLFVGAGDFKKWQSVGPNSIPLEIYSRQSVASNVDAQNLFDITNKGLAYYQQFFDYRYPFEKYGQVFVPNFNPGAMENPGAVTLNEKMIFRDKPSKVELTDRADTILHEMAHMWFGDLVTMNWWNDLWLNESFATYMSYLALDQAFDLKEAWLDFYGEKSWGYWQDSLVTTHPVEASIENTDEAVSNFDGITYAKGAAALKQLHFFAGADGFQSGVRSYFKKYAFKNSSREDFTQSIAEASRRNLMPWTSAWLKSAGTNRVHVEWECSAGKISKLNFIQEKNSGGSLSPHRARIGLFNHELKTDEVVLSSQVDAEYSDRVTPVREAIGRACPEFVYPNVDDLDYATFALDSVSRAFAGRHLSQFKSSLLRALLWDTMARMVRDGQMKPQAFIKTLMDNIGAEKDGGVLNIALGKEALANTIYGNYLSVAERKSLAPKLENMLWSAVRANSEDRELTLSFFDIVLRFAQTKPSLKSLSDLLKGRGAADFPRLEQGRRWRVILALAKNGVKNANDLIKAERAKDNTNSGEIAALRALGAIPTTKNKEYVWEYAIKQKNLANVRALTSLFSNPNYPKLSEIFVDRYFKMVGTMDWRSKSWLLANIYFENLFPGNLCSAAVLKKSEAAFKQVGHNLPSHVSRAWREDNDELARCIRVLKM